MYIEWVYPPHAMYCGLSHLQREDHAYPLPVTGGYLTAMV